VSGAPRQLLHDDADAAVGALEVVHELGDDFALSAHRPEAEDRVTRGFQPARAGEHQQRDEYRGSYSPVWSHPPENPARSSPRRTYAFFRITRQMRPLR
jgi:hypothetical protein